MKGEQGDKGDSNILTIGTVEKGEEAAANITGDSPNQVLNLTLPKGDKGDRGDTGEQGEPGYTPVKGTDYFTDEEIQQIKNKVLDEVNQFSVEVVSELPIENINEHTIYFVPKTDAEKEDVYDEYIFVNGDWEHIGTTEVDLSNCYNKTEIDEKMQDLDKVKVSSTEPTTGEKVWIQKGKNLFDKNNVNKLVGYIDGNGNFNIDNENRRTLYIECMANTVYTISRTAGTYFRVASFDQEIRRTVCMVNGEFLNPTAEKLTLDTGDNAIYLAVSYYDSSTDTLTEQEILDSIQIEQGSEATEYEKYIEPTIYVKNDNDVYEELISKEDAIKTIAYKNSDNDYGQAIRFPDGTMIVTQSHRVFQNCVDSYGSGLYCTAENTPTDFPVPFISIPYVTFSEDSAYAGSFAVKGATRASTTNAGTYKNVHNSSIQGIFGVDIVAVGRWK